MWHTLVILFTLLFLSACAPRSENLRVAAVHFPHEIPALVARGHDVNAR